MTDDHIGLIVNEPNLKMLVHYQTIFEEKFKKSGLFTQSLKDHRIWYNSTLILTICFVPCKSVTTYSVLETTDKIQPEYRPQTLEGLSKLQLLRKIEGIDFIKMHSKEDISKAVKFLNKVLDKDSI